MTSRNVLCIGFLVALALVAVPALAQTTIPAGIDLLHSQAGTYVDFSDNPLPTNFFGCGETFGGQVPVNGKPLAASKAIGNADTVIHRPNPITLVGGTGTGIIRIGALSLHSNAWTDPCGNSWQVDVCLDPASSQPNGSITITQSSATGGTFSSAMTVIGLVTWTNTAGDVLTAVDTVSLSSAGACWNNVPGAGGVTVTSPVSIDTNCDGVPDTSFPGTNGFYPGWCGTVSTPIPENGPHPTNPPKKCRKYAQTQVQQQLSTRAEATAAVALAIACADPIEPVPVE
ncbi:MAG TPA: hypothetical protein VF017_21140 [Thermoanaerobaculia bacterium]|nr:hypothetical protein [Thermoanaerobaculia bacterium]